MNPMGTGSLQLLLLATAVSLGCFTLQTAASTVNVSSSAQLLTALQSTADRIVLQHDVAMGPEFNQLEESPLQITRNITVTGADGNSTSIDAMPVLDFQNKVGILTLCSRCTFALLWVSVKNENRAGTGGGMTVFRGRPGSRVEWTGGVGLRPACPPSRPQLALLNSTQRSGLFPSPPGGQQLADVVNFTHRGKVYLDALQVIDLSSDVVPQQLTHSSFTGGYGIHRRNATRLCEHIVSEQCLQRRLPEDCIAELLSGGSSSGGGNATGPGPTQRTVAAIAVPVAVGGLLVLLAAAALLVWRQSTHRRQSQAAAKPHAGTTCLLIGPSASGLDVESGADQDTQRGGRSAPSKQPSSSSLTQQPALYGGDGWQLVWSSSTPNTDWKPQDNIELGVLLGAGSFARVYKGRWSGLDVAVKVIHHDLESAKDVALEVQLMLNLNHPNIVRAYHCITKQLNHTGTPQQQQLADAGPVLSQVRPTTTYLPELRGASSIPTGGSALSALQPATPIPGSEAALYASNHAATTFTGTGNLSLVRAGVFSSSGVCSFVQDLDAAALPAYQRRSFQQRPSALPAATTDTAVAPTATGQGEHSPRQLPAAVAETEYSQQQEAATCSSADPGLGFAVMSFPVPSAAVTGGDGPSIIVSGSAISTASTDSLLVPRSMSTLQGSAGPSNIGSLIGSRGSVNSQAYPPLSSTVSLPAAVNPAQQHTLPSRGLVPGLAGSSAAASQVAGVSQGILAPTSAAVAPGPSFPAGRGGSGSSSRLAGPLLPALPGHLSLLSLGHISEGLTQGNSSLGLLAAGSAGLSSQGLPAAGSAAASGSGPSILISSSTPSRASTGSQAWPQLIVSSSREARGERELQEAEESDVLGAWGVHDAEGGGTRSIAGSRGGSGSGKRGGCMVGAEVLCETWLVTELCDRGTLARQASEWQPESSEQDMLCLLHLLRDVACGLKLLKSQSIVHADLNAHNVLVASSSVARHGLVAKIADLGLSRMLKQQSTHRTTRTVGMLTHQPPELLKDGRMSPAVDIYSFGIMMYEVFTRQAAYARLRYGQIYNQVVVMGARPAVPPDMPEDYELLMKRCWSAGVSDRPSVDMLLECLDLMIQDRHEPAAAGRSTAGSYADR